jgi:hypothetical protein
LPVEGGCEAGEPGALELADGRKCGSPAAELVEDFADVVVGPGAAGSLASAVARDHHLV